MMKKFSSKKCLYELDIYNNSSSSDSGGSSSSSSGGSSSSSRSTTTTDFKSEDQFSWDSDSSFYDPNKDYKYIPSKKHIKSNTTQYSCIKDLIGTQKLALLLDNGTQAICISSKRLAYIKGYAIENSLDFARLLLLASKPYSAVTSSLKRTDSFGSFF
jgi:hypothetical protein